MNFKELSLIDWLWLKLGRLFKTNKVPLLSALIAGFLAHGFALTNKLVNHDEIESLFGKGATITSGRWGLELSKLLFPDRSMPWIYGIISILLLSISVCLIIRILSIRSVTAQVLLSALMLSFPSVTGTLCFMFTSSAYALSFLLAVLSVWEYRFGGRLRIVLSLIFLILALSIYQAYISVVACLYILLMIEDLLEADSEIKPVIFFGLKALAIMSAGIALYYAVTLLVFSFSGAEFNDYVLENVNGSLGIIRRIRMAYDAFLYIFSFRNFYLAPTELSRYIHIGLVTLLPLSLGAIAYRNKKSLHAVALLILMALLPLAICCMYLIMSGESIHTLVLYSFTAVYMLTAILLDRLSGLIGRIIKDAFAVLLALILLINIYFANTCYLKMEIDFDNAKAFYTSLIAQVIDTDGFDENCKLAIIGRQENLLYPFDEFDTELMMGPSRELINIYSRENLFRYYLGFDVPFANDEELERLEGDERIQSMSEYPYYGSVMKLDDFIVVKLG